MNQFRINNCVKCDNCTVDNKGKDHEEKHFFITCDLKVWEGQRGVRISEQFASIPNICPLIETDEADF